VETDDRLKAGHSFDPESEIHLDCAIDVGTVETATRSRNVDGLAFIVRSSGPATRSVAGDSDDPTIDSSLAMSSGPKLNRSAQGHPVLIGSIPPIGMSSAWPCWWFWTCLCAPGRSRTLFSPFQAAYASPHPRSRESAGTDSGRKSNCQTY
jgi:hypothetical protein